MPVEINGRTYYRTAEVCQTVGIGKSTLFHWMKENIVKEAEHRDRKGWRLFTGHEIDILMAEARRIQKNHVAEIPKIPLSLK